jgi:hypothetical protein
MPFKQLTMDYVLKQLNTLKTNKAIGLDHISGRLLKDASAIISNSLTQLFNQSLQSGSFPNVWKMGKVTALFKSGNRNNTNNYRPITVLPIISKILEKAVHGQIYRYLNEHKLLTSKQFGFREKLSTTVALIHFTDTMHLEKHGR